MLVQDAISAPPINLARKHHAYDLIAAEMVYETVQLARIANLNGENQATTAQLTMLDRGMNILMDLRDKKPVDHGAVQDVFSALHRDFPDMQFEKFAETYGQLSEDEIEHAERKLTNKEKLLLSKFNPKMSQIEECFSDKTKVHEIIAEIIKQLTEEGKHFVRNQQPR